MGCADVNEKYVSSKARDMLMPCGTSTFAIIFFKCYFTSKMNISKIEQRIKLKNKSGVFLL
jgi:hypothetical protein